MVYCFNEPFSFLHQGSSTLAKVSKSGWVRSLRHKVPRFTVNKFPLELMASNIKKGIRNLVIFLIWGQGILFSYSMFLEEAHNWESEKHGRLENPSKVPFLESKSLLVTSMPLIVVEASVYASANPPFTYPFDFFEELGDGGPHVLKIRGRLKRKYDI